MSQQTTQFYEVDFRVRTTKGHPLFEQYKAGVLSLWMLAVDAQHAQKKAEHIAAILPYKLLAAEIYLVEGRPNLADWQVDCLANAALMGMNIAFQGFATEAEFTAAMGPGWPLLLPLLEGD